MTHPFERIDYAKLNSKQQENYNFHEAAFVLAAFGFHSMKLSDDWNGADFIAVHVSGHTMNVQLKGRAHINRKYDAQNPWVCFPDRRHGSWYLIPHDELKRLALDGTTVAKTESWKGTGSYSWPQLSKAMLKKLEPFLLPR